ncbi:hypothetical protein ACRRTK_003751 [Alexandromys fortis]
MAVFRSLLPQLGLLLCLALGFSPAFSASYNDPCMVFDTIYNSTSDNLGISTHMESSGGNTSWTVRVPVNSSISAVILKVTNQSSPSEGAWVGADQECNDTSVLYRVTPSNSSIVARWTVPNSENVTEVSLQVFLASANQTAITSSVTLERRETSAPLTPTPKIPGTSQTTTVTTAKTPTKTPAMTTEKTMSTAKTTTMAKTTAMAKTTTMTKTTAMAKTTTMTKTTARSLAVNALGSPLAGALHILLVFLVSKLLF